MPHSHTNNLSAPLLCSCTHDGDTLSSAVVLSPQQDDDDVVVDTKMIYSIRILIQRLQTTNE